MLHYNTITAKTLELLKKLQAVPEFSELQLVRGTSLALQIGHRNSIDIDLFGKISIDEFALNETLSSFGTLIQLKKSKIFFVRNVGFLWKQISRWFGFSGCKKFNLF